VAGEEGEDLLPAVHGLLGAVDRRVVVEEGVAGAVVPVELEVLAEPREFRLVLVDLGGRGVRVVVAEQAEQRRGQAGGEVDRRSFCPAGGRDRREMFTKGWLQFR